MSQDKKYEFFFFNWNWKWRLLTCSILVITYMLIIEPIFMIFKIEPMKNDLESKYGLIIRYKNPIKFYTPNLKIPPEIDISNLKVEPVKEMMVPYVLKAVSEALDLYPPELIKKNLSAIFIGGKITVSGVECSAATVSSWIYIAAPPSWVKSRSEYALSLHHEFSSLLFHGAPFPWMDWDLVNHGDFRYLERYEDIVNAADLKNRQDPKLAHQWYEQGFVSDYGMSDMENDFNTYVELAFGDPKKLWDLMKTYPRIAKKAALLVKFYTGLAPEMCSYFESNGLTTGCHKDKFSG